MLLGPVSITVFQGIRWRVPEISLTRKQLLRHDLWRQEIPTSLNFKISNQGPSNTGNMSNIIHSSSLTVF